MTEKYKIKIPQYCNLDNFEKLLQDNFESSLSNKKISIIFDNFEWIGPLQVNLIYEWISILIDNGIEVNIEIISNVGDIYYLSGISFFKELSKLGVTLVGMLPQSKLYGLAAFKCFDNINELSSYEKTLEDKNSIHFLIGDDGSTDLVKDGDFKDIVIHELGENAFFHGDGKNVRFSVREFQKRIDRKSTKILPSFEGKAFIETVVSDSGNGLIKSLKKYVPKNWEPDQQFVSSRKLSQDALTVLYAFEFSSTSNEEGRKERLEKIIKEAKEEVDIIPTGLFYVGSLAKLYGGQIIVRTGRTLVSLDFTDGQNIIVYSQSNFAFIRGTHLLVRVPKERNRISPIKLEQQDPDKKTLNKKMHFLPLGEVAKESTSSADLLFHSEKRLTRSYVAAQKDNIKPVVILCDGVHPDTKFFSYFLILLTAIPRRSRSLILMGVRSELFEVAKSQWNKMSSMHHDTNSRLKRIKGYKSYIIVKDDFSEKLIFGDNTQLGSTVYCGEKNPCCENEYNSYQLSCFYAEAVISQLQSMIKKPPVKHPDKYYLIESKYYTPTFYEIGKLVNDKFGSELSLSYIKIIIRNNNIGSVFVISEPLFEFVDFIKNYIHEVKWIKRDVQYERSSFVNAINSLSNNEKLMILSDVICTGSEINKYLVMVYNFSKLIISCFVDGREENYPYFVVKKEKQAISVDVTCIHSDPIIPIKDLAGDNVKKVLIIDQKTHAPTSYDHIKIPELSPDQLLEKCKEYSSLYCGHLEFRGKHYSAFLYFAQLFKSITPELIEWWETTIDAYKRKNIKLKDVVVHYLDEQKGYEKIIYDFMSTKGVGKLEPLQVIDLVAPPEAIEQKKYIWFILPAMASGNTVMRCLEYATRYEVKEVNISIIVSRVDSTRLSFYQNITGYRNCPNINIETLNCLPVSAYPSESHCPQCTISKSLDEIKKIVSGYNYLTNIIKSGTELFELKKIELDELGSEHTHSATSNDYIIVVMRLYYEEALRKVEQRKALTSLLKVGGMSTIFFEMVGEEFNSTKFKRDVFKKIIYDPHYSELAREAKNILDKSANSALSYKCVLGIHSLFPEFLSENIKNYFLNAFVNSNKQTCDSLLFIALLELRKYGLAIASVDDLTSDGVSWKNNLIDDLRTFPYWHDSEFSISVHDYSKLLWILRRSTPWGSTIEYLRALIQTKGCTKSDIKKAVSVFCSGGIRTVQNLIGRLENREKRKPGNFWGAVLSENDNINDVINNIETTGISLNALSENEDTDLNRDSLLLAVKNIDNYGRELVACLQNIYTNPIDVKRRITEIAPKKWPNSKISTIFKFAEDQPGILISLEDMIQCTTHILDNANDCVMKYKSVAQNDFWVEFNFSGFTKDQRGSRLVIRDNLPWSTSISLSGGMKQFVKYCEKYAAVYDFTQSPLDPHQKIFVIYKIDDKRERHGEY